MGQGDGVTHRIIEHASVWSLQGYSQTSYAMAAPGQGGVSLSCSQTLIGTQWSERRRSCMSGKNSVHH